MKNKNLAGVLILVALAAVAGFLIYNNRKGTIRQELKDFAVADTARIDMIFLADKTGNRATIKRVGPSKWVVNDKFPARQDAVNNLLKTIKGVQVTQPVSKAAFDNVIKRLASTGIKVEIYQGGDEPVKVYYVGGPTHDGLGTFMMLENSATPFITGIQGFNGYLTPRYLTSPEIWRSTEVFAYKPSEIEKIEIRYPNSPGKGFSLEGVATGQPVLKTETGVQISYDTSKVYGYINNFRNLSGEYYIKQGEMRQSKQDSVFSIRPAFVIKVTDIYGKTKTLEGFANPVPEGTTNIEGVPIQYDLERLYGVVNGNRKDLIVIQYFAFDPVTLEPRDFAVEGVVKN